MKYIAFTFFVLLFPFISNAQYALQDEFANLTECDTMTRGIYVVWWDNDNDFTAEAEVLLDSMMTYRNICLNQLSMMDPPNPLDGFYYNVYIHTGDAGDIFTPYGWGNGQGTDGNGYPYLTLPDGVFTDWVNNAHETFHIFQYNATAPGFSYSGDSQWYIEASANWFAAKQNPGAERAFIEGESLVRVSHVPLWLSYDNFPAEYSPNWQRYVHQYALAMLLYYLTDVAGVNDSIITSGMFSNTNELPQEYFFNQIGGDAFRSYFVDYAAHMINEFDFIDPLQAAANEQEWIWYAELSDDNQYIETYLNTGTDGWYQPADEVVTNAWSFNTYKIQNSMDKTYYFELNGELVGSYSDSSHFGGKILVQNSVSGASFYDLEMMNKYQGSYALNASSTDTAIYFIIASMPEIFEDVNPSFQLFRYHMKIETNPESIHPIQENFNRTEVARFNMLGQPVQSDAKGIQIIYFKDGTRKRIINLENKY